MTPDFERAVLEAAIRDVRSAVAGRTRYEGQPPRRDELFVAEIERLRDRIARAVAELDAAPDVNPDQPSKRQTQALADANLRAWTVLTQGRDPPSRRRPEDALQRGERS